MKKLLRNLTVVATVLVLTLSFAGCSLFVLSDPPKNADKPDTSLITHSVSFSSSSESGRQELSKVDAVKKVEKSVVAIYVEQGNSASSGSGVIVDIVKKNSDGEEIVEDGVFYVLTCHHVIDGKGEITIYLPDAEGDNPYESDYDEENYAFSGVIGGAKNKYSVELVGGDKDSDVAILKLTVENEAIASAIKPVQIAPIDQTVYKVEKGTDVFAVGNPSGTLPGTVSFGSISYVNRETSISNIGNMTLFQLNVDIYHGSSGGGLFNMYGELIGITNAGSDENSGLNYAIPYVIDFAAEEADKGFVNVAEQLVKTSTESNYGYVKGRLVKFGFEVVQKTLDDEVSTRVLVTGVTKGGKAATAGLKVNDVIKSVYVNDQLKVESVSQNKQLTEVITKLNDGDKLTIEVERYDYVLTSTHSITMTADQYIFCDTGA